MKRLRLPYWTVPLALLGVCILAFGLLIPWLGFYQDDWYQVWFGRAFGNGVYPGFFARERPFIAWIYMLTMPLVGAQPLHWQIFALIARWLAVIAVWWTLRQVWPRHTLQVTLAALLCTIYPAFRVQYAAVIYSHYFLQMAIQVVSMGTMVLAVRRQRWFWPLTGFSILAALAALLLSEYFFGLEWLRPVFLWIALSERHKESVRQRLKRVIGYLAPYLTLTMGFLVWRILVFKFPTYQPFYLQNPGSGWGVKLFQLAQKVLVSVLRVGLYTWIEPATLLGQIGSRLPSVLAALGLALASAVMLFFYLAALEPARTRGAGDEGSERGALEPGRVGGALESGGGETMKTERRVSLEMCLAGSYSLFLAGWPFWFVNLPVDTAIESGSRFTISFMLGASLMAAGLITLLLKRRHLNIAMVAAITGLAIGWHFKDANLYRQIHQDQATFFQELAWRAPGLKRGTLLLTNTFPELLSGDNSLTAALNWVYESSPPYGLDYMLFYLPSRIDWGSLPGLESGLTVSKDFRTARYQGSTSQILAAFYPYPECLRVLDPNVEAGLPRPVDMPKELKEAAPLSNLGQILTDPAKPAQLPKNIFRYIPEENSWCYFYEKADLARQEGDWQAAADYADQALSQGRKLASTWELMPFIEGYARSGQLVKARELTLQAHQANPDGRAMTSEILCATWERIKQAPGNKVSGDLITGASELLQELDCEN